MLNTKNVGFIITFTGFLMLWTDVFILRLGSVSFAGTLLLASIFLPLSITLLFKRKKVLILFFFCLVFLGFSYDHVSRDIFVVIIVFFLFKSHLFFREAFQSAITAFFFIGSFFILMAIFGVFGELKVSESRFLGRYSMGFATPYHFSEFVLVYGFIAYVHIRKKFYLASIFSLLAFFLILSASRVSLVAAAITIFSSLHKRRVIRFLASITLLALNVWLVYYLAISEGLTDISSYRDLVVKSVLASYGDSWINNDYKVILFGIINNHNFATLVEVSRWETQAPLDGLIIKMLGSGIVGFFSALIFVIYMIIKSVKYEKTYKLVILLLVLGFGADMLNLWHLIVPYTMYYLVKEEECEVV